MTDSIESLLPLQPTTFHILLSLSDEDRHGYAIILDVARRTNGELKLSAGTLYRSIHRVQRDQKSRRCNPDLISVDKKR